MTDISEKKESVISKVGGWFGIILAIVAGLFFLDQGEIFSETLPEAWTQLKQLVERGVVKAQKAYWRCGILVRDYLRVGKRITIVWWVVAGILLVAGIVGKSQGWSENSTLALRLIGIYLFAGYWFALAMLAKPLYYGLHALKKGAAAAAKAVGGSANHWLGKLGLETPVPQLSAASAEKIEAGAMAFQRFFFTIASIVLLFGTFFAPSGEMSTAVGLAMLGMPLAALAAFAAKHGWKSERGWKLLGVAVLIAFFVLTFTVFGTTLVPAPIRQWFAGRNRSQLVALTLFGIPTALWIAAAFWKSKSDGLNKAAKRLFWVCSILLAVFCVTGTVTSKELTGHPVIADDKMRDVQEIVDAKWQQKVDKERKDLGMQPKYGSGTGSTGAGSGGTYLAPPPGSSGGTENRSAGQEAPKPPAVAPTRIRKEAVAPSPEAPKQYASPGQVLNDLDDTGY